ncbi:hypothetical protein CKO36_04450 [Rhabdochromatium marinum]|nr:hypothetical protein [Rhabdochromatium marinum]
MSPGYQHQPGYQHRMPRPTYSGRAAPRSRQMPTLIKDMTDAGYRLTIRLTPQQQPQDIKIEARGHSLIIRSAQTQITRSEQSPTQGRGYSRHFSVSSRRFQRRIRVPADANLSAMTRSDENQAVVVILPRN